MPHAGLWGVVALFGPTAYPLALRRFNPNRLYMIWEMTLMELVLNALFLSAYISAAMFFGKITLKPYFMGSWLEENLYCECFMYFIIIIIILQIDRLYYLLLRSPPKVTLFFKQANMDSDNIL